MGNRFGRRKKATPAATTPFPPYINPGGTPQAGGISRPGVGGGAVNPNQQRELMQANQTIQNLTNQLNAMRGGGGVGGGGMGMPYGSYPMGGGMGQPPMPYGAPGMLGGMPPYAPASPLLQHVPGHNPFAYPQLMQQQQQQQQMPIGGSKVYRDTDFAALASIAGLTPADIALLHREFLNLTQNGSSRLDRVIFRQLLRDVLMEVNSENVDRAIENIFVSVDRNHDGYIDFPEFVGAFKDVLKGDTGDSQDYLSSQGFPDMLTQQIRASGVGSGVSQQAIGYAQQAAPPAQQFISQGGLSVVPLASLGMQQSPMFYSGGMSLPMSNGNPPFLSMDPNQSSYVIATPGQYLITQPTALQCVPLPLA